MDDLFGGEQLDDDESSNLQTLIQVAESCSRNLDAGNPTDTQLGYSGT